MRNGCERTMQPHLQAGQFLEMWLLLREKAADFSECQHEEKRWGENPQRGIVHCCWWQTWKANGEELCRGNAREEEGKKRPVEFFFWLPERPPPQSLLSLKQFEKMSSKITYYCIFSVDNNTQYRTPGYSSQDVPVLLLCIKSKLFFSFIFILFLWRVLHSGEKKREKDCTLIYCLKNVILRNISVVVEEESRLLLIFI